LARGDDPQVAEFAQALGTELHTKARRLVAREGNIRVGVDVLVDPDRPRFIEPDTRDRLAADARLIDRKRAGNHGAAIDVGQGEVSGELIEVDTKGLDPLPIGLDDGVLPRIGMRQGHVGVDAAGELLQRQRRKTVEIARVKCELAGCEIGSVERNPALRRNRADAHVYPIENGAAGRRPRDMEGASRRLAVYFPVETDVGVERTSEI
jgi:hypothetical protein